MTIPPPPPIGLLAELTHRCPLQCAYCSNPIALEKRSVELTTDEWRRVFSEADELGILQLHLSGGEPASRADLEKLVEHCAKLGLYTNLITSGMLLDEGRLARLSDAGLDHIQLSLQDVDPLNADLMGGLKGAHARKLALGRRITSLGLPLTINAVIHRQNIGSIEAMIDLALELGARRVEVAHVQYYGWALKNRSHLMPSRQQAIEAYALLKELQRKHSGSIVIDSVLPDYYARVPKACMGGWGARVININPAGKALPCHAAETIPGLSFWSVREHGLSEIWTDSPAFNAYRGDDWMAEPCTTCDKKRLCKGGCRCQALALAGQAHLADPVCELSPFHAYVTEAAAQAALNAQGAAVPRRIG